MSQNWASIGIMLFQTDFNHSPVLGIPLKRTLNLEDEARPAELKSCHPWGECKFTLQMRKGGLVRIHDSILMAESKYKCLLISEHTTGELHPIVIFFYHTFFVIQMCKFFLKSTKF